ncbi:MAG: DUF4013 domain-containing protein [Calditrichaeota bacterium]|nr:MAG: DUF4013 domain-containing protein [Calditrichota bacterium]
MNYSEALYFTFRDEKWIKKILIGGVFTFISFYCGLFFILGFFVMGYYLHVIKNVMRNEKTPLPDWSDLGKIFVDGVVGTIIFFIYFILIGLLFTLPIVRIASDPFIMGVEKGITITFISLITLIAWFLVINTALIQFSINNNFSSAFNLLEILNFIKDNFGNLLAIAIFSAILNGILFLAGLGILAPFTNFWGLVIQAHLLGQCGLEHFKSTPMVKAA